MTVKTSSINTGEHDAAGYIRELEELISEEGRRIEGLRSRIAMSIEALDKARKYICMPG